MKSQYRIDKEWNDYHSKETYVPKIRKWFIWWTIKDHLPHSRHRLDLLTKSEALNVIEFHKHQQVSRDVCRSWVKTAKKNFKKETFKVTFKVE